MPLDSRSFTDDRFPRWAEEPPVPAEGSLVPGSQFHEEQWIMAAGMLARGSSFLHVSRAMGCSRTTLWRAYYGSQDFRHRVWWERQALNREAELRLSSIRMLVAEQIERLVSAGDPSTVRWLAERLGLFAGLDLPATRRQAARSDDRPDQPPAPKPADPKPPAPKPEAPPAVTVPEPDDDLPADHPGTLRERIPPNPERVAAILARPEAAGPTGLYPWAINPGDLTPDDSHPGLTPGPVGRRAAGPVSHRR